MSAPLPEALRARFQRLIEEDLSGRTAALRLHLSPATGARRPGPVSADGSPSTTTSGLMPPMEGTRPP